MTDSDNKNSVAIVDYGMGNIASVKYDKKNWRKLYFYK